jgi:hypothetical protein
MSRPLPSARRLTGLLPVLLAVLLAACSQGAKDGASSGAKTGAVGGLVAGAVGSIFWGGDAVNNALRAGAVGAASGAAVGAMSGADRNKKQAPAPAPQPAPGQTSGQASGQAADLSAADQALKTRIGDLNFAAGEELARCRHVSAISRAEKAFASETDARRKGYALLIEAMAAEESSNTAKANAVYAQWGQFDATRADAAKARNEALEGLLKVQKVRQDHGLPPLCT